MKVFSVTGLTGSGKTSTIESIIGELVSRGFSVGTVKDIHFEAFTIDTEGKNTWRHRQAGAYTVTALSKLETDVMYKGKMPIYQVLKHYTEDYVILEGSNDAIAPNIAVAREDAEPRVSPLTVAISGRYSNTHFGRFDVDNNYTIPIINGVEDTKTLVDLIVAVTPELMQDIAVECCGECGYECRQLLANVLRGEGSLKKCVLNSGSVSVTIEDDKMVLVPFVEKLVKNAVLGVVSELKGYKKGKRIVVEFLDD